jgi:glycosyltransferase involved in cell wall biosynthesis
LQLGRTLRRHGHEVAFAAFWGLHGTPQIFDGFPVFPGSAEDQFARDVLPLWYGQFGADLCITLLDVFALDPGQLQGMNLAHWMPVDCDRLSSMDAGLLSGSPGRPVAMSRHGERAMRAAGLDPLYAPHALDMDAWSPLTDRDEGRARLGWTGKFVVGINAANQDPNRKGFAEQIAAFARFAARHDDALMVIHSRALTQFGQNLPALIDRYGLNTRVLLTPQEAVAGGLIPEQGMVSFHGAVDVLSNCAYGEGFGLSVLQSQACGTPVIVTGCSAMNELCGAGWKVTGQDFWHLRHNANWRVPFISSIDQAYEKAYARARDPQLREKARRFALRYDAEKVFAAHWKQILAQLDPRRPVTLTGPPRVFAPVMFRDEADMLAMRLAETDAGVDRHVIVEAPVTHRMVPKELAYAKAGKRLARYAPIRG